MLADAKRGLNWNWAGKSLGKKGREREGQVK